MYIPLSQTRAVQSDSKTTSGAVTIGSFGSEFSSNKS